MKKLLIILLGCCLMPAYARLYRAKLPIAYCGSGVVVGFTHHADGMWGNDGEIADSSKSCYPEVFSPRGDYSVVYYTSDYCPEDSDRQVWIPLERLIVALKKNSRIVYSSHCSVMLIDPHLFMVLKSNLALERLEQILPDKGGLCHVEYRNPRL